MKLKCDFVSTILLTALATLLIVGGVYIYTRHKQGTQLSATNSTTHTTATAQLPSMEKLGADVTLTHFATSTEVHFGRFSFVLPSTWRGRYTQSQVYGEHELFLQMDADSQTVTDTTSTPYIDIQCPPGYKTVLLDEDYLPGSKYRSFANNGNTFHISLNRRLDLSHGEGPWAFLFNLIVSNSDGGIECIGGGRPTQDIAPAIDELYSSFK